MNHYDTLEVSPRASPAVIKAAYRSLMQRHHPDKNENDPASTQKTLALAAAYEVLSDAGQRLAYDQQLKFAEQVKVRSAVSGGRQPLGAPMVQHRRPLSWLAWTALGLLLLMVLAVVIRGIKNGALKSDPASLGQTSVPAALVQPKVALEEPPPRNPAAAEPEKSTANAIVLHRFIDNLTVVLPNVPAKTPDHLAAIFIAEINLKVGSYDGINIINKLNSNKELIRDNIVSKLKSSQINNLSELEDLVMKVIQDVSETSILERYPGPLSETLGKYGVLGVQFPRNYSIVDIKTPNTIQ